MTIFTNKLAATALAGVISLGVLGGGAYALNQGSDGPTSASAQQADATGTPKPGKGDHHELRQAFLATIDDIVAASGVPKDQITQGLKDGKSFNQIITEHNGNLPAVQSSILTAVTARINAAVTSGKLKQDEATKLIEKLKTELPKLMDATHKPKSTNGTPPNGKKPDGHGQHGFGALGRAGELDAVATALNIPKAQLIQELMGGSKSIADVAKAHNVDLNIVINAMVADASKHIDDAVSAGKLDSTKATEIKSHLKDMITKLVNMTMPKGPGGHAPGNRGPKPAPTTTS